MKSASESNEDESEEYEEDVANRVVPDDVDEAVDRLAAAVDERKVLERLKPSGDERHRKNIQIHRIGYLGEDANK